MNRRALAIILGFELKRMLMGPRGVLTLLAMLISLVPTCFWVKRLAEELKIVDAIGRIRDYRQNALRRTETHEADLLRPALLCGTLEHARVAHILRRHRREPRRAASIDGLVAAAGARWR